MYMGFCTLVYQYHENVSPVLLFAVHGFFFPYYFFRATVNNVYSSGD